MKRILYVAFYFLFWLLLCIASKCLFFLYYAKDGNAQISDLLSVISHGLPMELSTACYFVCFALLIILISCFFCINKYFDKAIRIYTYLFSVIFFIAIAADLVLYKYWGFRLDTTPLFYLQTPKAAMASATTADFVLGLSVIAFCAALSILSFLFFHKKIFPLDEKRNLLSVIPCIIIGIILFIMMRGGTSVSTMNTGRVYFSDNMFLNHAAINPFWNFINSMTHDNDFGGKYTFYDTKEAQELFDTHLRNRTSTPDSLVLNSKRPNIFIIILESCGATICEPLGGEKGVAPNISKFYDEGISFTNYIGNTFRTDRGVVSILSGYPAQPTTSIMKYSEKSQSIPKFPLKLKENGYDIKFYYGGDVNFTNMRSYLIMSGFEKITSIDDFNREELSEKWGAYDHALFQKVLSELNTQTEEPFCKVMLTLSSHEPFDVPIRKFDDKYLNSVAYTDSCLGAFISSLKQSKWWDNSLIIILPDHAFGHYPKASPNFSIRTHQIPMVWIGGAVKKPIKVESYFSQIDLSRTLLSQLNIDASEFKFSKDIFASTSPQFGFYTFTDGFCMISDEGHCIYDCAGENTIECTSDSLKSLGKAFLQVLMTDFTER